MDIFLIILEIISETKDLAKEQGIEPFVHVVVLDTGILLFKANMLDGKEIFSFAVRPENLRRSRDKVLDQFNEKFKTLNPKYN